jgi:hypothetical protein
MSRAELRVQRVPFENLLIEKLPDGSTAVFDTGSGTVHSLNSSAAAAFEACRESCTVAFVARAMSELLNAGVSEDVALAAISELEAAGLVVCSGAVEAAGHGASRRSMLEALAAVSSVALPMVLSLGASEQKAFAAGAGSGTTTSTTTTTTTTSAPGQIIGVSPNVAAGCVQDQYTFTITGQNTHFNQGATQVTAEGLLVVGAVTVASPTQLTAVVSGFSNYTLPFYVGNVINLRVTTGLEVLFTGSYLIFGSCG